jgi:hypothetical protein
VIGRWIVSQSVILLVLFQRPAVQKTIVVLLYMSLPRSYSSINILNKKKIKYVLLVKHQNHLLKITTLSSLIVDCLFSFQPNLSYSIY